MTFNSWEFLLFYPIVALLYFVLPKRAKWVMLLIASYFFYVLYQAELVFLILGTTLISWLSSHAVTRTKSTALRRLALTLTLIVSLGTLFFFKYFNFISDTATGLINLFGGEASPVMLDLVLPVGISFYTFQTLSYAIDVYRGDVEPEKNFFFYALFISFFPQLVAGPIERPGNLIPQLKEPKPWSSDDAIKGAKHMMLGFFKKVCVADFISVAVNSVYNSPEDSSALAVIIATVLFSLQIYCDFSGYTDIAIGCARIMGIRLMKNFDHPYMATTIKEFWSRWHISLSTWFKDYLYIPLGGNRVSRARHLLNLFIVFLVSGLWHGASLTFVLWGAVHGIYQVVGTLTAAPRRALIEKLGFSEKSGGVLIIRRILTFILVGIAWIFFRANSIADVGVIFSRLAVWDVPLGEVISSLGLDLHSVLYIVISFLVLLILDRVLTYDGEGDSSHIMTLGGRYVYIVWGILLSWVLLLSKDMISTFIYFQF